MKLNKWKLEIDALIRSLFTALFILTPLVMSSTTSELFEFNKMMLVYATTIVIGFFYVVHLFLSSEVSRPHLSLLPLLAFLGMMTISTLFSIDQHTSLFGYYGRWNGGLLSIFCYISLFYIFIQVMSREYIEFLLKSTVVVSFLIVIWGLSGYIGLDLSCYAFTGIIGNNCWSSDFDPAVRMFSTLGQPNWLGAYLAIHFWLGWYFLTRNVKWYLPSDFLTKIFIPSKILYIVYLLLVLFGLFATRSRSAMIAVLITFTIYVVHKYFTRLNKNKKIIVILLLIFISLLFAVIFRKNIQGWIALPTQSSTISESSDIRKVVWRGAIELGNRYPLTGSGLETFAYAYYFTRPAAHNLTSEWDFVYNKAHNEYLNYLGTTGYTGLFVYLIMIGSMIYFGVKTYVDLKKKNDFENAYLVKMLIFAYLTILITNFFGFSVSSIQIFFYLIPGMWIIMNKVKINRTELSSTSFSELSKSNKLALLSSLLLAGMGLFYVLIYYQADVYYSKGKKDIDNDDYAEASNNLKRALNLKYEHVYEDKYSLALANLAFENSQVKNDSDSQKYVYLSKAVNKNAINNSPLNTLYWMTRGKNYYLYYQVSGNEDDLFEAVRSVEKASKIAPTDVQTRYSLAIFYWIVANEGKDKKVRKNYLERTKSTLMEILNQKPNYIEAQELLGSI